MYSASVKAQYIADDAARAKAWEEALTTNIPKHLGFLEKLVGENGQFSANRLLVGDVLIICGLKVVLEIEGNSHALDAFPKLKAFYTKHNDAVLGDLAKVILSFARL